MNGRGRPRTAAKLGRPSNAERAKKAAEAARSLVTPDQLEALSTWRSEGALRSFSLSREHGVTLGETRGGVRYEAHLQNAEAACAACAAGELEWRPVASASAAGRVPEPVVRPKPAKPKSIAKLIRSPAA